MESAIESRTAIDVRDITRSVKTRAVVSKMLKGKSVETLVDTVVKS